MFSAIALIVPRKGADFELQKVELDMLQPQEILVKLIATGICHTDLAVQHGKIPMPFPVALGHEGAGIVVAVGTERSEFQEGDHVILSFNSCSSCRSCLMSRQFHCTDILARNFGGNRPDGSQAILSKHGPIHGCFFGQSSFCNPAVVQAACCVKVDPNLPLSILCALGCGFQTGAGSIFNVVKPLERKVRHIAIFGAGGVGFAALMAARYLVDETRGILDAIIVVDINDDRLNLAKQLGATHVINSATDDLQKRVQGITNAAGLDAAVDCTGVIAVVEAMISLVGPGGMAVTVGGPSPGLTASVDVFDLLIGAKTYRGCHQGNADAKKFIPFLADLYSNGKLPLESLQKTYKASDINVAAEEMQKGLVIKPILLWD